MRSPRAIVRRLLPVLLCLGCDKGPRTLDAVLHLDLRLADGRSPAALLAGAPPIETSFGGGADGPWSFADTAARRTLRLAGPFPAAEYPLLELRAEGATDLRCHATWTAGGADRELRATPAPASQPGLHALRLGDAPGWRGEVRDLVLRFEPGADVKILAASLVSEGFDLGAEPLGPADAPAAERSGDAGLVALGLEAHRAWPSARGVPLFATVTVPERGRLAVRVGTLDARPARFTVAARRGREWQPLGAAVAAGAWKPLAIDLAADAGREIELRFLAGTPDGPAEAAGDVPARAEVLWGEPFVGGARPASRRPNVVLITLDTTRGDVVGRGITPHLDALAARGTRFERTFATTNSTIPSHASIFTGLPLAEHGALGNRHAFGPENRTLAERLRAFGYHTSAAVSVGLLRPGFGFGQGFDRYELPHPEAHRDGAPATRAAERWIDEHAAAGTPFFLWLHLFDPHTPYGPPDEFADAFLRERGLERPPRGAEPATMPVWDQPPAQLTFARGVSNLDWMRFEYELGVAYADQLVGRVLSRIEAADAKEAMDATGTTGGTLVLVTSDHGESFGERDFWFEHGNLYPEVIHVPLILAGPRVPEGGVVEHEVSTIDLLPTILGAAGRPDASLAGIDLRALARGAAPPDRRLWFQLSDGRQAGFRDDELHFVTTLSDGLRWIAGAERNGDGERVPRFVSEPAGTHHLFDLHADPAAERDLGASDAARAALASEAVREWLASRDRARSERRELSAAEEQQLQDLGYAGDE